MHVKSLHQTLKLDFFLFLYPQVHIKCTLKCVIYHHYISKSENNEIDLIKSKFRKVSREFMNLNKLCSKRTVLPDIWRLHRKCNWHKMGWESGLCITDLILDRWWVRGCICRKNIDYLTNCTCWLLDNLFVFLVLKTFTHLFVLLMIAFIRTVQKTRVPAEGASRNEMFDH